MSSRPAYWRITPTLVLATTVALGGSAAIVSGQIELAAIVGTVTDEEGRPLEGVTVLLRDVERGREVEVETNEDGRFFRRGLRAIEYELVVEKAGYQPIHDKLELNAGRELRFNFELVRAVPEGAEEFAIGVEAFNRGDNQAAVEAFEAALQKAPDVPEVRVNLGLAYLRLDRDTDAVAQLQRAATLAPDNPTVQFQLGGAYVEMQDLEKAAAALEHGLALQPDLTDPLAWDATTTLAAVYFAQGENDRAIAEFEKALAARPESPAATLGLGKAWFSKGDADQALELFEQIVASAPGSAEAAEAEAFIKELEKGAGGVR